MLDAHNRTVNLVIAVDSEGGYAKDGTIPWNIPEDMKQFQALTKGGVCIMGRNTYVDMINIQQARRSSDAEAPKAILPGRESYVISSNPDFDPVGASSGTGITSVINSLPDGDERNIFILGGRRLFVEALGRPCIVHMSIIKGDPYDCDDFFPLDVLNTHYTIVGGHQSELCYNVVYHPIPQQRATTQEEMWEQIIHANFRPVRS